MYTVLKERIDGAGATPKFTGFFGLRGHDKPRLIMGVAMISIDPDSRWYRLKNLLPDFQRNYDLEKLTIGHTPPEV